MYQIVLQISANFK